jgi:hypothetical protein
VRNERFLLFKGLAEVPTLITIGLDLPSTPAAGTTEIWAPFAFTNTGERSGVIPETGSLANGLLMKVERKDPVATKAKAITVIPSILFIGMLLSVEKSGCVSNNK